MLKIKNVSKKYKSGAVEALSDVSFSVKRGEFVALLGQNGAGKSTLINILAGNVKKNSGEVLIGGVNLDTDELKTKNIIGVVPQEIIFDYVFSVEEVLEHQSGYFGIKNNSDYIDELLESLRLSNKKKSSSRSLSGGMKRRLLIAKAMVHKPDLLILDEPTAGVDIELRQHLYLFLEKLHESGTTIILTTHYLEEAEKLCDRVIVINQGRIIADENKDRLMATLGTETLLEFEFDQDIDLKNFSFLSQFSPEIRDLRKLNLKVFQKDIGIVFQKMNEENKKYSGFKLQPKRLEDVYLQLVNGNRETA